MSNLGPSPAVVNLISKIVLETATRQDFLDVTPKYTKLCTILSSDIVVNTLGEFDITLPPMQTSDSLGFDNGKGTTFVYSIFSNLLSNTNAYLVYHREKLL